MEQTELKKIKKIYGENFMQLCRELFPTLLEQEGTLLKILSSKFANNSKTLYEDIVNKGLEGKFKNYIYSQIDVEKEKASIIEEKTPKQLLEEVGYDLIECTTEEEIQKFRRYYAQNEELCTFRGGRLNRCVVFFAIRKDVDEIKREDFKNPKREDKYGTSVMGIQFSKMGRCTVSIKNRYNHTVNNPDATYGNDLDKIILGLTQSFAKLLKDRGLELNSENIEKFEIPGYVVAGDGKYYKYNYEINGTYYCPGNTIIEHGEVKQLENPEKQVLIDYFIVDTEKKTIQVYDHTIKDSFTDAFEDLGKEDKIEIRKNKEKGTREIRIQRKEKSEPIVIEINKDNQIIGYKNNNLEQVGDNFLYSNKALTEIELPNLEQIGNNFLYYNRALTKIEMLNLKQVGDDFLRNNEALTEIELPNLKQVGNDFLSHNNVLTEIKLPELKQVGDNFLSCNNALTEIKLPKLEQVGDGFLICNEVLTDLKLPKLEQIGDDFLYNNGALTELEMPKLRQIGCNFLHKNEILTEIKLPELRQVKNCFLYRNRELTQLEILKLEQVGYNFLPYNQTLTKIKLPELKQVGDDFLYWNQVLIELEMTKLEEVGDGFLYSNKILSELGITDLAEIKEVLSVNTNLKYKKQQTIDANDILQLDKSNQITESEINSGGEFISNMDRDIDKNKKIEK